MRTNDITSAYGAFAVTPSDSTTFNVTQRALYVGASGDLAVTMDSGDVVTFVGVPGGTLLPIQVSKVMATNTTATNIVALY